MPLPLLALSSDLSLDKSHDLAGRLTESLGQLQDGRERRLLLTKFQSADIGAPKVGIKPQLLLTEPGFKP